MRYTKQYNAKTERWLVIDGEDNRPIAAGMSEREAETFAARHNLRHVWGK